MAARRRWTSWWRTPWIYPWSFLKEPRVLSAIMAILYLSIVVLIGLPTLLVLPGTGLADHFDLSLAVLAGIPLVAGGIIAAISLWGRAWFLERGGIVLIIGGLIVRAVIVVALPDTDAVTAIGVGEVWALSLALAARFFIIRGLDLDPREV